MPTIYGYPGETNPNDIKASDPTVLRGAVAITLTGDVTAPAGLVAGTLVETFTASGDVSAPAGAIAGTLRETFTLAGDVTAPTGLVVGTLAEGFALSGDVTAPAGQVAGTLDAAVGGTNYGLGGVGGWAHAFGQKPTVSIDTVTLRGGISAPVGQVAGRIAVQAVVTLGGGIAAPVGTMAGSLRMSDDQLALWLLGWEDAA